MPAFNKTPLIIAHRGVSEYCPENTLPAFEYLFQKEDPKIDGIETDVQLSKDGIPVLFHDSTLKRITGHKKKINDLTLEELKKLDFGAWFNSSFKGVKILTLEEFLLRYGKKIELYIEIKTEESDPLEINLELTKKIVSIICKQNMEKRVRILSFNKDMLFQAYKISKAMRYILNMEYTLPATDSFFKENRWISGYGIEITLLSEEFISKAHEHGKSVFPFVCNTADEAEMLLKLGVDGLFSNNPFLVEEYFRNVSIR